METGGDCAATMKSDLRRFDCTWPSLPAKLTACLSGASILATAMYIAINEWNDKNWPYTVHDERHIESNRRYMMCEYPSVTHNIALTTQNRTATASWSIWRQEAGCVYNIAIARTELCWETTNSPTSSYVLGDGCTVVTGSFVSR